MVQPKQGEGKASKQSKLVKTMKQGRRAKPINEKNLVEKLGTSKFAEKDNKDDAKGAEGADGPPMDKLFVGKCNVISGSD